MSDPSRMVETLKAKAMLLIQREREVYALRQGRERMIAWLQAFQRLSAKARTESGSATYAEWTAIMLDELHFQTAAAFELDDATGELALVYGQSHAPVERAIALDEAARRLLDERPEGAFAGGTEPGLVSLSRSLRLQRFLWFVARHGGERRILLVAGVAEGIVGAQGATSRDDLIHFTMLGRHLAVLVSNYSLIGELEREKWRLAESNEILGKRTADLATTLESLRDKDRRLSDDLEQARAFQQSILPVLPFSPFVEFEAVYRPLDEVGGDVYDVHEIEPNRFRVFLADATGHGVQASLRTILLKAEYDRIKTKHMRPVTLMAALNRRLLSAYRHGDMLCTACCFDIELRPGHGARLSYTNAAHPPLLRVAGGVCSDIYVDGSFLGLSPHASFAEHETDLAGGDLVLAYTDGLSDQPGSGNRSFDIRSAIETAVRVDAPGRFLGQRLIDELAAFLAPRPISDDIVAVSARIRTEARAG